MNSGGKIKWIPIYKEGEISEKKYDFQNAEILLFLLFFYTHDNFLNFPMRTLTYALKNIFRNSFLSISTIMVMVLMVFFVNILVFAGFTTEQLIDFTNNKLGISLYLKPWFSEENSHVIDLKNELYTTFPSIEQTYVTKESGLEEIRKRDPALAELVETGAENPLPNSIRISGININEYDKLDQVINTYQDIIEYDRTNESKMITYKDQANTIEPTVFVLYSIKYGVYILIGLFFFTVFVVLYNVVGNFIFFFRDEMKIIMLVGGSPTFIYGPFALQACIYGFIGSGGAVLFSVLLFRFTDFREYTGFIRSFFESFALFLPWEIAIFSLLGLISGYLASRRYIRLIRESVHEA